MEERDWPEEKDTDERLPAEPADDVEPSRSPGGVDPVTGEQERSESSNADIPAG